MKDRTPLDGSPHPPSSLLQLAYRYAERSRSLTTQVGAVVYSRGRLSGAWNKEVGGHWLHAEVSALRAFRQYSQDPVDLITTWGPCLECAKTMVLDGSVKAVHRHHPLGRIHPKWEESIRQGVELLTAAGILVVDHLLCEHPPYLFNGVLQWTDK